MSGLDLLALFAGSFPRHCLTEDLEWYTNGPQPRRHEQESVSPNADSVLLPQTRCGVTSGPLTVVPV